MTRDQDTRTARRNRARRAERNAKPSAVCPRCGAWTDYGPHVQIETIDLERYRATGRYETTMVPCPNAPKED